MSTILKSAKPTSFYHVRLFLGFCNFYQYFILNFSKLAKLLTTLTKKDTLFDWLSFYQSTFESLKKMVTEIPKLVYYKQDVKTIVKTD